VRKGCVEAELGKGQVCRQQWDARSARFVPVGLGMSVHGMGLCETAPGRCAMTDEAQMSCPQ